MRKQNITENLKFDSKKLARIAEKFDLRFVILHGSYSTGKQHPKSDLDIAFMEKTALDFKKQLDLHIELKDVFGENIKNLDLDSKTLHGADPLFRYHVVRDGILLYGDITDYNEYKAVSHRIYEDARPLFELEKKLAERFQKHLTNTYVG